MDYAPDIPTAGYERYVSESESTDGEGDVSGGQRKSKVAAATAGFETAAAGEGDRNNESYHHGKALASPAPTASIFSRLAASWKKGSNSARGTKRTNGITHHRDNKHPAAAGAPGAASRGGRRGEGEEMWRDIQEGSLRGGDYGEGPGLGFSGESGSRCV